MFNCNFKRKTNANSDAQQAMRDAAQGCGVLTVASPVISSGPGDQRTSQDLPFVIRAQVFPSAGRQGLCLDKVQLSYSSDPFYVLECCQQPRPLPQQKSGVPLEGNDIIVYALFLLKSVFKMSPTGDIALVVWSLTHVQFFCDLMDCSPPGSSVHGISQARILEWTAISFTRRTSQPRDSTHVSCIGRQIPYL